jgi:hypothetical protein
MICKKSEDGTTSGSDLEKTNEQKGDNPVPQLSVMGTLRRELLRQNKVFKMCRDTPDQ